MVRILIGREGPTDATLMIKDSDTGWSKEFLIESFPWQILAFIQCHHIEYNSQEFLKALLYLVNLERYETKGDECT